MIAEPKPLFGNSPQKEQTQITKTEADLAENDLKNGQARKIVAENLTDKVTLAQVRNAVPAHLYASVTQELVDQLNNVAADPLIGSQIRENFLGYTKVMVEGRFKLDDYLHAVKYVSYKLLGYNNEEAWSLSVS